MPSFAPPGSPGQVLVSVPVPTPVAQPAPKPQAALAQPAPPQDDESLFQQVSAPPLMLLPHGPISKKPQSPAEQMRRIGQLLRLKRSHQIATETVSTRVPTAKKVATPTGPLFSNFEALQEDPESLKRGLRLMLQYPGLKSLRTRVDNKSLGGISNAVINHLRDNILTLYHLTPEWIRQRSKLWYDGGNRIVHQIAKEHNIEPRAAAGVIAALSPQQNWFVNVDIAKRLISIINGQQGAPWTSRMEAEGRALIDRSGTDEGKVANGALLDAIRGKSLSQITEPVEQAMWARLHDAAHNTPEFDVLSPEGNSVGRAVTKEGNAGSIRWGGMSLLAKAISILYDDSMQNISQQLGKQHKIRNFYNNLIDPNSPHGHTTIDTHAVAAALIAPLSGSSVPVAHNFAGAGAPKSSITGLQGTYPIYHEAYVRAAKKAGVTPREMQSITWEAVRGMFSPEFKRDKKGRDAIASIWKDYDDGKLSRLQAIRQIAKTIGGIEYPFWARGSSGPGNDQAGAPDDTGVLPGGQPPRRRSKSVPAGTGGAPAAGVPATTQFSSKLKLVDMPKAKKYAVPAEDANPEVLRRIGDVLRMANEPMSPLEFSEEAHRLSTEAEGHPYATESLEARTYARNGNSQKAAKFHKQAAEWHTRRLAELPPYHGSLKKHEAARDAHVIAALTHSTYEPDTRPNEMLPEDYHMHASGEPLRFNQLREIASRLQLAYRSPAGGMVVRGTYYPGGEIIPGNAIQPPPTPQAKLSAAAPEPPQDPLHGKTVIITGLYRPEPNRLARAGHDDDAFGNLPVEHVGMSSPNMRTGLSFPEAHADLTGERQRQHQKVIQSAMQDMGIDPSKVSLLQGYGDWAPPEDPASHSVESSIVHIIHEPLDEARSLALGELIRSRAKQHSVLVFRPDPSGADMLSRVFLPGTTPQEVRELLDQRGIGIRTIIPEGKKGDGHTPGQHVVVFNRGRNQETIARMQELASEFGSRHHQTVGRGTLVAAGQGS